MSDTQNPSKQSGLIASNWKPLEQSTTTLQGFFDLTFRPSGIVVYRCMLHENQNGRWVAAQGIPKLDRDKNLVKLPSGKPDYVPSIGFETREARDNFNRIALAALDALIASGR